MISLLLLAVSIAISPIESSSLTPRVAVWHMKNWDEPWIQYAPAPIYASTTYASFSFKSSLYEVARHSGPGLTVSKLPLTLCSFSPETFGAAIDPFRSLNK
ncbi:hypothetical protein BDW66DRAFT_92707 [Aspergillus desertorum]